jgi:hypothetical protein
MHMDSTLGGSTFTPQGHLAPAGSSADSCRVASTESHDSAAVQARMSSILAENRELRAEVESLKADRARMAEILSRLAEVLGSKSPDKLVHDLRNVLNERELYRALADSVM